MKPFASASGAARLVAALAVTCLMGAGPALCAGSLAVTMREYEPAAAQLEKSRRKVRDHKGVEAPDEPAVRPFHKRPRRSEPLRRRLCSICHGPWPHGKSATARAFLNMHGRALTCTVCHLETGGRPVSFRRLPPPQGAAEGEEGEIAPFFGTEAQVVFDDDPLFSELERIWEGGALEEKARWHAKVHGPLRKRPRRCRDCHGRGAKLLDLSVLGYGEAEIRALETDRRARILDMYEKRKKRLRLRGLLD